MLDLQFVGGRKKQDVGQRNPVDRGNKGNGDSSTYLFNVIEVLHYLDQSKYCADNSNRRRVTACGFINLGRLFAAFFHVLQLHLHGLTKFLRLASVDSHEDSLAEEVILDAGDVLLQ